MKRVVVRTLKDVSNPNVARTKLSMDSEEVAQNLVSPLMGLNSECFECVFYYFGLVGILRY